MRRWHLRLVAGSIRATAGLAALLVLAFLPATGARAAPPDRTPVKDFMLIHTGDGLGEILPCG